MRDAWPEKPSTPTELDKELERIIDTVTTAVLSEGKTGFTRTDTVKALKQAVDKYVIGKPIDVHGRANIYASKPGTEGFEQKWYDLGTNGRVEEQRQSLWSQSPADDFHDRNNRVRKS